MTRLLQLADCQATVSPIFQLPALVGLLSGALVACGTPNVAHSPPAAAPSEAAASAGADSNPSATPPTASPIAAEPPGPRPPDFELETLDGDSVRLGDHLGKDVILIDFWATYCDPCLTAMPHLDELYRKYRDQGFVVLGVSIDGPESAAQVRTEVSKLGVTFPILLDTESEVVALYNPKTSAPYSVLIGRSGRVLTKQEGYTTGSADRLDADVAKAMAQ